MPEIVNRFAVPMQTLSPEDQGFRAFVVVDPGFVEVPGCIEIHELRLNGHTIPAYEDHKVPEDATHQNFKQIRVPIYQLMEGPNGIPVVVRSLNSNDGKWQVDTTLHIRGAWTDDKPGKVTSADGLDEMKVAELIELAQTEFGHDFPTVGTSKAKVAAFIREERAKKGS